MAKPQLEDGYTMIANEILETLAKTHIRPDDWRILIFIIRKTYGYHKKVDYISNSQIVKGVHLHKTTVSHSLKRLELANLITRNGKVIGFQRDYVQWKLEKSPTNEKLEILPTGLEISPTKVGSPLVTQKKKYTLTKEKTTVKSEKLEILPTPLEEELIAILERLPFFARDRHVSLYSDSVLKLREVMSDYPGLDYKLELKKVVEYWGAERRKLKKPWLALRNWLERAPKQTPKLAGSSHYRDLAEVQDE